MGGGGEGGGQTCNPRHTYLFIFYRWCHKQGFCPCSGLSPINKYVQICWVYKIVEKNLCHKRYTFFPIHNFIPSLVEPKTLFNDVLRGVPSFFHRKLRFLSFLKIKALTWPATHYWSPYTQFQKLEAVWIHSPQTILADNPLQILLKYRFS